MFNFKFAYKNIKNNIRICLPFMLISLVFYILLFSTIALGDSTSLLKVEFGDNIWEIMRTPIILLAFINSIAVTSAFSFGLSKRTDEFKLYNLLGAKYRDILILISKELVLLYIFIISIGTLSGIAIGKFFYLVFINVIDVSYFNLEISFSIIIFSSLYYCLSLFFIIILSSIIIWKTIKSSHIHVKTKRYNEIKNFCVSFIIFLLLLIMDIFFYSKILKLVILILIIFVSIYFLLSYCLSKCIQLIIKKDMYYKKLNFLSINIVLKEISNNSLKLAFSTFLLLVSAISMIISFSGFYSESPISLNSISINNIAYSKVKHFNNLEIVALDTSKKENNSIYDGDKPDFLLIKELKGRVTNSKTNRIMNKDLTELGIISMISILISISLSLLCGSILFNSNVYLVNRKKEINFSFTNLFLSTVDKIRWQRIKNIIFFLTPIFLYTMGLIIVLPLLLKTIQLLGVRDTKIIINTTIVVTFINFLLYSLSFFFVKLINSLFSKE